MNDIDKLARAVAKQMGGLNDYEDSDFHIIKTALAAYANDYCDSLLFVLADIRQKTGVGDKPMLDELADAIVANKTAYGDETYRNGQSDMKSVCVDIADKHGTVVCYNKIRAIPLPSEKVKP